jgi:hypothetical protein
MRSIHLCDCAARPPGLALEAACCGLVYLAAMASLDRTLALHESQGLAGISIGTLLLTRRKLTMQIRACDAFLLDKTRLTER